MDISKVYCNFTLSQSKCCWQFSQAPQMPPAIAMARASSGEPQLPSRLDESEWILGCKMLRGVSIHNFEGDAPGPPGILSLKSSYRGHHHHHHHFSNPTWSIIFLKKKLNMSKSVPSFASLVTIFQFFPFFHVSLNPVIGLREHLQETHGFYH